MPDGVWVVFVYVSSCFYFVTFILLRCDNGLCPQQQTYTDHLVLTAALSCPLLSARFLTEVGGPRGTARHI